MCNKVSVKMANKVRNLWESYYPLLFLNSVMGLTVFETPSRKSWLKLSILYAIGRSIGFGFLLWNAEVITKSVKNDVPTLNSVFKLIVYINVFIGAISTVIGLMQYKAKEKFFKKITLIDETLEVFGIDPEYTQTFKKNLKLIVLWSCIGISIFGSDLAITYIVYGNWRYAILTTFIFEYPLILNHMVELNFSVKISTIGDRFERLNALIQSVTTSPLYAANSESTNKYQHILKNNQSKVAVKPQYYFKNRNNIELLLKAARQLHLDLCTTARSVNDICSKQMSMQMGATFILLTGFSYSLYVVYNKPHILFKNKMQYYGSLGLWIIISIVRMIYVVRTSVNVALEAHKTSQIAHEIHVPKSQSKLTDEIHQLSLQIMQHPLSFTASGLVVLDFGYVRGFVGSVTTYLMILIQNQPDMIKAANTLVEGTQNDNNTSIESTTIKT